MAQNTLEGRARELVEDKNFAHVSIPRDDGTVQTVVVWAHTDNQGNIELNSAEGRAWPANLRRAGGATVSVANPDNPYEYVSVTGRLAGDTHEGADEHIDMLAKKYMDVDSYPYRQDGEQRVKFTLEPERVNHAAQ
jgi:PPOX class probable F420-dependent enzyme